MGLPKAEADQELYAPDTKNVIPAKAGIQNDLRTAIRRGGLTYICCFLCCIAFSVLPVMAEDTTFVLLKDWWEYTDQEKQFLRDRWTNEKVDAVVTALKEGKPLLDFVDKLQDTLLGLPIYRADLRGISLWLGGLQEINLTFACMQGANLFMAHLQGADLMGANLQVVNLREADLQGTDFSDAVFENTFLYRPKLDSTVGYRDIQWRNCYVGDDLLTYRDLKRLYRNAGMDELVTKFHYWDNWVKTRKLSVFEAIPRFLFLEWTYGYGSRPWWLLPYSLGVIFLFSIIFFLPTLFPRANLGIYTSKPDSARKRRLTWRQPHECLYFSLLAFATFGYGAIRPKQWLQLFRLKLVEHEPVGWIRIFVGLEAALGIWVLALLVTVLFGR